MGLNRIASLSDILTWGETYGSKPAISQDGIITVGWLEYGIAGNDHKLRTENLYTCMGIALFNPERRVGFLEHIAMDEYMNKGMLHDMVNEAEQMLRAQMGTAYTPAFKGVILGVSSIPEYDCFSAKKEAVENATEFLVRKGYEVHSAPFLFALEMRRVVTLDCATGVADVKGSVNDVLVEEGSINLSTGKSALKLNYSLATNPCFGE